MRGVRIFALKIVLPDEVLERTIDAILAELRQDEADNGHTPAYIIVTLNQSRQRLMLQSYRLIRGDNPPLAEMRTPYERSTTEKWTVAVRIDSTAMEACKHRAVGGPGGSSQGSGGEDTDDDEEEGVTDAERMAPWRRLEVEGVPGAMHVRRVRIPCPSSDKGKGKKRKRADRR